MKTIHELMMPGKMSFILGGQYGSEGKGAAAAYVAAKLIENGQMFQVVTTNAGVQSGHTSVHKGRKRVQFHIPTATVVAHDAAVRGELPLKRLPMTYLNAGSIIDPDVLLKELEEIPALPERFYIHPNAAVITPECKEAEMRGDSAQTKIASTRKGVGEALARKVLRSGVIARDHPRLKEFVRRVDLQTRMAVGDAVLAEIPQGFSLGLNQKFYPHCTSRDCTVGQAMSDAQVHPAFYGASMLVLRTFPIRVGNIQDAIMRDNKPEMVLGYSGDCYPDQSETSWEKVGVEPEITTVTRRVRRVFTFSVQQMLDAVAVTRPAAVFLSFCDYRPQDVEKLSLAIEISRGVFFPPLMLYGYGPSTDDVSTFIRGLE